MTAQKLDNLQEVQMDSEVSLENLKAVLKDLLAFPSDMARMIVHVDKSLIATMYSKPAGNVVLRKHFVKSESGRGSILNSFQKIDFTSETADETAPKLVTAIVWGGQMPLKKIEKKSGKFAIILNVPEAIADKFDSVPVDSMDDAEMFFEKALSHKNFIAIIDPQEMHKHVDAGLLDDAKLSEDLLIAFNVAPIVKSYKNNSIRKSAEKEWQDAQKLAVSPTRKAELQKEKDKDESDAKNKALSEPLLPKVDLKTVAGSVKDTMKPLVTGLVNQNSKLSADDLALLKSIVASLESK